MSGSKGGGDTATQPKIAVEDALWAMSCEPSYLPAELARVFSNSGQAKAVVVVWTGLSEDPGDVSKLGNETVTSANWAPM